MDLLQWLEEWYQSQCNGDWEHCYVIKIETVDNPGWLVTIDVAETLLEDKIFDEYDKCISNSDWMFCLIRDKKFIGSGDPDKLFPILEIFKAWVETQEN